MDNSNMNPPMSIYPDEGGKFDFSDEWAESPEICPRCKNRRMWRADKRPNPKKENSRTGSKYICGKCEHFETRIK